MDPEGPKAIEEKLRQYPSLTLSRLRPAPVDGSLLNVCKCGNNFGMMVRQHHCRSCGQIFCWECTTQKVNIPEALVEYRNREGWWSANALSRICNECYRRFLHYEECLPLLAGLYGRPQPLERILQLESGNEMTKRSLVYYLSEMKRIQYLFPSEMLNSYQTDFLRANRVALSTNPEAWLMQILKVESITSTRKLTVHNAIDMIIFSHIYRNSIEIALKVIYESNPEELIPYLPIMSSIPDLRLYDVLVEKSIGSPSMAFSFYWALNVLSESSNPKGELAISHRENLLVRIGELGSTLINFRRFIGTIGRGLISMRTSVEQHPPPDPLDLQRRIVSVDKIVDGTSHSHPLFITYTSAVVPTEIDEKMEKSVRTIMFKREDTRRDACIIKIIKMLACNLKHLASPFPLISYSVIPINNRSGIVEIVEKSQTLFSIATNGSINNYLQHHNAERTIGDVQKTYTLSLAFWTVITYVFGVGDRHFDNIMLSTSGILFHIDYGFIFGIDPKPYSPKIRLNTYMLEGIGGETKYGEFKELCYQIFIGMKKNLDQIYTFLLELALAEPKIEGLVVTESFIRDHLSKVFFVGDSEDRIRSKLEFIIDSSKDSLGATIGEYFHSTAKTTSKYFGKLIGTSSSPV